VRRTKQKKTGDPYAVKIIEKKFVEQQDLMLLAREIEIMKKVDHPNVIPFYCVFDIDHLRFLDSSKFSKQTKLLPWLWNCTN
jgi:serine/threonine protein kinase